MFNVFMNTISGLKDKGVSATAKLALSLYCKPYGEVRELRLDSRNKNLTIVLLLNGEQEPVEIMVRDYHVTKQGDQDMLVAGCIETSRQWLTTVAVTYLQGRSIPISPELAMGLQIVA
jgi:hypothetical protein